MRLALLALVALVLLPSTTGAASLSGMADNVGQAPFTITLSPQYPLPYGSATITFLSDTLDLANATLSVTVAKKIIYQGGVQPVSVPLSKPGLPVTATATITSNRVKYMQAVTVIPQDVTLIVEPISSAAPLYQGKASVPLEGNVRVVAVANLRTALGKAIDPATLAYTWTVDSTTLANSSGIGKQALLVATPLQYRTRTVSVTVMSQDGSLVGGDSLSLSGEGPTVRIYENDPLLGVRFERALTGSYSIAGAESTLYAAPFSLPTSQGAPSIQWFLDGSPAQTGASITLRPPGSGGGSASLSLTAAADGASTATAALSVLFGSKQSNFFGL